MKTNATAIHCSYTKIENLKNLKEHPRNPNRHGPEQIRLLAKNIKTLGWRHPILVSSLSGYIVAGHARLQAAREIGVKTAPVDVQPFENESDEMAYLVADNKIAELSEIQASKIKQLLDQIKTEDIDIELTGYLETAATESGNEEDEASNEYENNYAEQYAVIVLCSDAEEAEETRSALQKKGYDAKVVAT
jgi:ParB-like chromosome segregation protein Spo0J